jgi:DNA repair exonuclease SbcCD nuclease subunit
MKILHLSDMHFKDTDVSQDIVLSSLKSKLKEIVKTEDCPNLILITGDIAFSGKKEEYEKASSFINEILALCKLGRDEVLVIPGNHDVDRAKIGKGHISWWYQFKNEGELSDNLNSEDSFPKIKSKVDSFYVFSKSCMDGVVPGKFGQYVYSAKNDSSKYALKIVGLNSALFCGYDGDEDRKLALGLEQVHSCEQQIDPEKDIVISCIHHPFTCFHPCETAGIQTIKRFSDIILSGHLHAATNTTQIDGDVGETIFITAGASYENREQENSFNIITLNLNTLNGASIAYKYLPSQHKWILNKDINPNTDGRFEFVIKRNSVIDQSVVSVSATSKKYVAVFDISYDDLNREQVDAAVSLLQTITGDSNMKITKMENGSLKIYFETTKQVPDDFDSKLIDSPGLKSVEVKILKNESTDNNDLNQPDNSVFHWRTFINPEFFQNIQNPGASFSHSRVDDLELKDLYVAPNLKVINIEDRNEKIERFISSDEAFEKKIGESIKIIIYGEDNSGKSTLLRWWFDKYYGQGYIPILISGSDVKDISLSKIKKLFQKEFNRQYNGRIEGDLSKFDQDRIIIMIDDFHRIRFTKPKYKANLISNLSLGVNNLILTGNDLMQFERYNSSNGLSTNTLIKFTRYTLLEFGPKLRFDLIKKWNGLGIDQLDQNEVIRLNIDTEKHVESIIGKNFVPAFPVYLLTILQARELNTVQKPEFSLHGFYYELLINEALDRAVKNKADISLYYNYITDYCYFLFENKIRFSPIELSDFYKFHAKYCEDYNVSVTFNHVIETLLSSKLIKLENSSITISYKYVYYYFAARYLANNISQPEIKRIITSLCERIHRDEFASIVMFLTHLSKDQFIIAQLLSNSRSLFTEHKPIQLESDVHFINDMISRLPEHIYEPIDVEKVKDDELKEEEQLELQEREFDKEQDILDYDLNEDISALDALSKMIKAMKTIEIIGQVTKKYWGELRAQQKFDLAEESYMLGLRTLGFHYSLIERDTEMLVEYLKHIYSKKFPRRSFSKVDIEKASRGFLFSICVMASYGIIKRITNSIGFEKLAGTFSEILTKHSFTSVRLIDTSIKLDYNRSFPWDEIRELKKYTDKHFLSDAVLKNLVINYLYMFYTSIEDRQRICSLLDIKIDQQRMIDATSAVKKTSS